MKKLLGLTLTLLSTFSLAGPHYVTGKVTSLKGSVDPAIRISSNVAPTDCNGGAYGWLYFEGTAQEKQWIYSTALAGKTVTVYTNNDGETCRIHNIQVTSGL